MPLLAVVNNFHHVCIAHSISDVITSRSSLTLLELVLNDIAGEDIEGFTMEDTNICYHRHSKHEILVVSDRICEYSSFLPYTSDTGDEYIYQYHAIGIK